MVRTHETTDETVVKSGTKGFLQRIRRIDVAGTWRRAACVHHKDGCGIVLKESRRRELWISELKMDGLQILGNLGGVDGSKKLGFSRTGWWRPLTVSWIYMPRARHQTWKRDR